LLGPLAYAQGWPDWSNTRKQDPLHEPMWEGNLCTKEGQQRVNYTLVRNDILYLEDHYMDEIPGQCKEDPLYY